MSEISSPFMIFDPPKEVLEALGEMTVRFQKLEKALKWFAVALMDTERTRPPMIVLNELSFGKLCNVTEAIARQRLPDNGDWLERFVQALKACREFEHKRNRFTHAEWAGSPDYPAVARWRRSRINKGEFGVAEEVLTAGELREFSREMERCIGVLVSLMEDPGLEMVLRDSECS